MNNINFLQEWRKDYKLLQQNKTTRKYLAEKYHKSTATIGNWLKYYEKYKVPFKTFSGKWNEHGIKIKGIRKFMLELDYHFNNCSGNPLYIYYNPSKRKIWLQEKLDPALQEYLLLKTKRNMYLSEIYTLIWLKEKNK